MFQHPGLTILAAPWIYAASAKFSRLSDPETRRKYDLADAVSYLDCYVVTHGSTPIPFAYLKERADHYRHEVSEVAYHEVDAAYRAHYGTHVIEFE